MGSDSLSREQREWLGLSEDESVRVLATSARSLVLERSRAGSAALPWDRALVLTADVRAFPIADLLHLIHAANKSGFLFFENGSHEKAVYLHRGEVVFASSNQLVDRLSECLLRTGAISLEQHREAERAFVLAEAAQFGKVLVEKGFLTAREVWNGVKGQVEEIVRSLFSYGVGTVMFWEGEVRPDNVVRLSLATRRLIAEGLRLRDELLKRLAWLESPRVRLEAVAGGGQRLGGTERAVYQALRSPTRFAALCRDVGLDPLSGARTLGHLQLIGAVEVSEASEDEILAEADLRHSGGDAVAECVLAHLKVLAELVAPIVALEGASGIRARLARVIEEGSSRFPDLLAGLVVGDHATLDPAPLIERALRFPGDREREVCLALGELVSYLEFELANHPQIDDPEQFLEAIAQLRDHL